MCQRYSALVLAMTIETMAVLASTILSIYGHGTEC